MRAEAMDKKGYSCEQVGYFLSTMATEADRRALKAFARSGGILRTRRALALGIHPRTLYRLRDEGRLVRVSRGVFRLSSLPRAGRPDLVAVATRVPRAVVCLVSALAFHDLTTEVPHEVHIALPRGTKVPRLEHPPLRVYRFSGPALTAGVQRVGVDGVPVQVYGPEKTVVDCFRFRNRLGLDVATEALRACLRRRGARRPDLLRFARLCRVERVMLPYLEALQ